MDMTAEAHEDAVIFPHFQRLFESLRDELPFIDRDVLSRVVKNAQQGLCAELKTEAPAVEARKARFSFFKLPAELRNRIYEMVLPVNKKFCVQIARRQRPYNRDEPSTYLFGRHSNRSLNPPTLSQVSRQLRQETLPIFYGQNSFISYIDTDYISKDDHNTRDLRGWLHEIGPDQARFVKNLVIRMPMPQNECTWRGSCAAQEPRDENRCRAWVPKSAVHVARTLGLLGGGVLLGSWKAELGATIGGVCFNDEDVIDEWFYSGPQRDLSEVLEWTALATPAPGEEVEVTEEDLAERIWDACDVYDNRDRDWEQSGQPYGERFEVEWYD